jgi:hypothetical protein
MYCLFARHYLEYSSERLKRIYDKNKSYSPILMSLLKDSEDCVKTIDASNLEIKRRGIG